MSGDIRICAAPGCPNRIERHPGEGLCRFKARQTCSRRCRSIMTSLRMRGSFIKTGASQMDATRICKAAGCENPIVRRPGEPSTDFRRRKCCCQRCADAVSAATTIARYAAMSAQYKHPPCAAPGCTNPVLRRDGQSLDAYKRRKTCCDDCSRAHREHRVRENAKALTLSDKPTRRAPVNDGIGSFAEHNLPLRSVVTKYDRPATHVSGEGRGLW